ncbi:endogenous retrovirus group K member 113 Gag polyprotein-like [Pipistrellus kuhlii]|uniref:CCHC-type domain-containing protein n=1 Tax=Pipistrellus kuhlii TaxID=59472 RepID=A0A7J7UM85_PIPKU|nr:endogenous retrovirus group K member 113 Gag polyprotein-like [Pipistrellus kuhlii]KAF6313912.1 hypothetical protein mPipKuh1_008765 [Pipistrellus kuhlii]
MGQGNSKELFVQVLKTMLRSRGTKVSSSQLHHFMQFVEEVCPWFPEEGTVNLETWVKVGERIQGYYEAHGPQKVPVDTFSLWALVRDCIDPRHEGQKAKEKVVAAEIPPVVTTPTAPPLEAAAVRKEEPLDPGDAEDLEEAAAHYRQEDDLILLSEQTAGGKAQQDPLRQAVLGLAKQLQAWQVVAQKMQKEMHTRAPTPTPSQRAGLEGPPLVEVDEEEGMQKPTGQQSRKGIRQKRGDERKKAPLKNAPFKGEVSSRGRSQKRSSSRSSLYSSTSGAETMGETTEIESGSESEKEEPGFTQRVKVLGKEEKLMVAMAQAGPGQKNDPGWGKVQASPSGLSPLQAALRDARMAGEDLDGFDQGGFLAYPVYEHPAQGNNPPQRVYGTIDFKKLKELKTACAQYGPTAPYTLVVLESINDDYTMCPNDWKQLAKACLSGGDYLLWKTEYVEECERTHRRNLANRIQSDLSAMIGEGQWADTQPQTTYNMAYYAQISLAARKAWKKLPTSKNITMDLTRIRQGPDELYQDFVSRLLDAAGKLIGEGEAGILIVKQLAFENANTACQAALRPYRHKGDINDYIRICQDIGPSYTTGVTLAAALKGQSLRQFLQQSPRGRGRGRRVPGPPGSCFSCGQMGHFTKECPQKAPVQSDQGGPGTAPGICPRCQKGRHWARDCRSKRDSQGNPLPTLQQGNWKRGQPQAPQTYGALQGALQGQSQRASNPFVTSTELPQEAQDWTSVPPPMQY